MEAIKSKKKTWKKFKYNRNPTIENNYRDARDIATRKGREAKGGIWKKLARKVKNNLESILDYVNPKTKVRKKIIGIKNKEVHTMKNKGEANILNENFCLIS